MEQVAIQPFLQGLATMDKVPVQYTSSALDAIMKGRESQDYVLNDLRRQADYDAQMDPLKIQHQQLLNQGMDLGNQEKGFTIQDLIRKDEIARHTFGQTKDLALEKLLTEAGAERTKRFEQELFDRLRDTPQSSPEWKKLMATAKQTRAFLMEQQKHEHAIEVARINASAVLGKEAMGIAAGKYNRAQFSMTIEDRLLKAKTAAERIQILTDAAIVAEQNGDVAQAVRYRQRANDPGQRDAQRYNLSEPRQSGAGGIDLSRVGNGGIPVRTTQPIPLAQPLTPTPQAQPQPAPQKSGMPAVGETRSGYRFKGGDPSKKENWEKI